jgi:hypothetical protein
MQDSSELTQVPNKEQNFEEWPVLVSLAQVNQEPRTTMGRDFSARKK